MTASSASCQQFCDEVGKFSRILALKLYRLRLDDPPAVPILPCLDHEAMLHEEVAPHAAAYIEDREGHLHEIVHVPDEHRIDVDSVSTMFERSQQAHEHLIEKLRGHFPDHRIRVVGRSWVRGDMRVMKACRAQVPLREVLTGPDLDKTKTAVDRLQTISSLMEKESRVASWSTRTVMAPFLAVAGFLSYQLLGAFAPRLGSQWAAFLQYSVVTLLGTCLLYYGLKAVQLTEMANRVWKRSAEYGLILSERRRLARK